MTEHRSFGRPDPWVPMGPTAASPTAPTPTGAAAPTPTGAAAPTPSVVAPSGLRLVDLDPRWLYRDGRRVGIVFKSPTKPDVWYQSCMFAPTLRGEQNELFNAAVGHLCEKPEYGFKKVQGCNEQCGWTVAGGVENATFDTLTITPSIDGSAGRLWHGFITNGAIQ